MKEGIFAIDTGMKEECMSRLEWKLQLEPTINKSEDSISVCKKETDPQLLLG